MPAIFDGTRLLVYRLLPKSIPDEGLKVAGFINFSNVRLLSYKVKISAATPVGDLELQVALEKENFIHGFSLHQVFILVSFY